MKIFGKELKFNGFDIWHKGIFDPETKANASHTHTKSNITDFPTSMPANGGDAETTDGFHLNQDVRSTASPTFATVYAPSLEGFKTNGDLLNKVIKPDVTQIAQSPISPFIWHDVLAFCRIGIPTFESSVDGSTWETATLNNLLFAHKENQAINVLNAATTKAVRWTWTTGNLAYSSIRWLLLAHTYTSPSPNMTVTIENSSDGITWNSTHTSTYSASSQPVWLYINNHGGSSRLRITITHNSGANINLSSIRALSNRWGDQGQGSELKYPYLWDGDMNMTVLGTTLKVGSNEVWHKGSLSPTDFATSAQGTKADNALPASSYTASDILAKLKTVDGETSGLDTDLLDGKNGSYYDIPFIVGTQTATTSSWTGIASELESLVDGTTIRYWLPRTSTSTSVTLDLTLKGGGTTGPIACYYGGTSRLTTHFSAGMLVVFTYVVNQSINGTLYTGWWAQANYDSNTTDRTYWANAITAGAPIYDYKLLMQGVDGKFYPITLENGTGTTKTISTEEFLINSPILFYNSTSDIALNSTTTNVYSEIPMTTLSYTANKASWVSQKPIYLKGTINANGNFVLDNTSYTSFMTQDLPTTEDGFVYVMLGYMYATTGMRLINYHPMYEYKGGKLRPYGDNSSELQSKANIASPTFTGTPKAPTPTTSDNSTNIATTAFVKAQGYITSAGSGAKISTSPTQPGTYGPGDFWYKEI